MEIHEIESPKWKCCDIADIGEKVLHLAIYPYKDDEGKVRILQVDDGMGTIFPKATATCFYAEGLEDEEDNMDGTIDNFLKYLQDAIKELVE